MFCTTFMVSVFLLDFFIRLFINPKYAPSMVVGRWIVNNQTPEYVGAPQKMWAWGFGFFLANNANIDKVKIVFCAKFRL
jgi:hypothetical protein